MQLTNEVYNKVIHPTKAITSSGGKSTEHLYSSTSTVTLLK